MVKIISSDLPTFFSEGYARGASALVDSHISISTPSCPSSPSRVMFIMSPSIGVEISPEVAGVHQHSQRGY